MLARLIVIALYVFLGCAACAGFAEVYSWWQPKRLPAPTPLEVEQNNARR